MKTYTVHIHGHGSREMKAFSATDAAERSGIWLVSDECSDVLTVVTDAEGKNTLLRLTVEYELTHTAVDEGEAEAETPDEEAFLAEVAPGEFA